MRSQLLGLRNLGCLILGNLLLQGHHDILIPAQPFQWITVQHLSLGAVLVKGPAVSHPALSRHPH